MGIQDLLLSRRVRQSGSVGVHDGAVPIMTERGGSNNGRGDW